MAYIPAGTVLNRLGREGAMAPITLSPGYAALQGRCRATSHASCFGGLCSVKCAHAQLLGGSDTRLSSIQLVRLNSTEMSSFMKLKR